MREKLLELKELRESMEKLMLQKKAGYDKYMSENVVVFGEIEDLSGKINDTEIKLKELALIEYSETGEKKLGYGVGIRVFKKMEYEEAMAFSWAKEHNMALSLDKRAFEKMARVDKPDFVVINEVPQATIPFKIEIKVEHRGDQGHH